MGLFGVLALLFVSVPILELVILIQLGQAVGLGPTLALVLATGIGGAMLARAEGLRTLLRFQGELASGEMPNQSIFDGLSVLVGGALLLTPGLITDVLGFSLLIPFTRRWIQRRVRARLMRMAEEGTIHVVTVGPGPWAQGGAWPQREGARPPKQEGAWPQRDDELESVVGLDPSKEIKVDSSGS